MGGCFATNQDIGIENNDFHFDSSYSSKKRSGGESLQISEQISASFMKAINESPYKKNDLFSKEFNDSINKVNHAETSLVKDILKINGKDVLLKWLKDKNK